MNTEKHIKIITEVFGEKAVKPIGDKSSAVIVLDSTDLNFLARLLKGKRDLAVID